MDVWLKSLPSEMSPEGSLPKTGFHQAFMGCDERHHSFQEWQGFREAKRTPAAAHRTGLLLILHRLLGMGAENCVDNHYHGCPFVLYLLQRPRLRPSTHLVLPPADGPHGFVAFAPEVLDLELHASVIAEALGMA